ncbi:MULTISPECIES: NIPSNAP family protein [Mumia]|uniref:NIPSNAP family protein n=1 Tax=Mumia TaxID=1546255 RepID=UPI001AB05481|nr:MULTISPECIES: NIPSNAP family protein [unclassified Mumia]
MPRTALLELRRYALHPGQRETLISLFDSEFLAPQEDAGMSVLGQFRDLDDPDQFVWMRGFDDAVSRGKSLQAFYGGPVWARNRDAANATMISSDDVLLLRPVSGGALTLSSAQEPSPPDLVVTTVYQPDDLDGFVALMEAAGEDRLTALGSARVAAYVSADVANTFPALPVRADARAYVRVARFATEAEHAAHVRRVTAAAASESVLQVVQSSIGEELRLTPTDRSVLR